MIDMPIGITIAFAENLDSFKYFSSLALVQQRQIIEHARTLKKQELKSYIRNLGRNSDLL